MLCDTRGLRFLSGTKSCNFRSTIPIFDPPIQRSNPWCSSWVFCMKKHKCKYSWTQSRNSWKKRVPIPLYVPYICFFLYIKTNDSNSYTWFCLGGKEIHCLCSISTMMETQTWRIWMSVRMCYWKDPMFPLRFSQTWKKIFTHPRAKNTLVVGPASIIKTYGILCCCDSSISGGRARNMSPSNKSHIFQHVENQPLKYENLNTPNYNIQSTTIHLKQNIPLSSVCFFSMLSKALHEKTGRQREHTSGKPGEPSVVNPSWVG